MKIELDINRLERPMVGVAIVLVIYAILFFYFSHLDFPVIKDETHFWKSSIHFSSTVVPSLELLRSYDDMNTPLPFYLFGQIHRLTDLGPQGGRILNFLMSFIVIILIIVQKNDKALFYGFALIMFPYFIGTGILLYTDMLCVFTVLLGFICYRGGAPIWSSLFFILAIASRQYALAFPLSLLAYSALQLAKTNDRIKRRKIYWTAFGMFVALLSLVPWIVIWNGVAPPISVRTTGLDTSMLRVFPDHPLYFMACVGFYFVLPEIVIERRQAVFQGSLWKPIVLVVIVCLWFVMYPPMNNVEYSVWTMGLLDKLSRGFLSDSMRMIWFCLLAILAGTRFLSTRLSSIIFWGNALLMLKAPIGWDKYILPLLVCLWCCKAMENNIEGGKKRKKSKQAHLVLEFRF
jgi:hypothetical protein